MKLTYGIALWNMFGRVHICREDGSDAYTLRCCPLGTILLFDENGEQLGSIDSNYNICLGADAFIGRAECIKTFLMERYQIHYDHFWTAEKIPGEDTFQVFIGQGKEIGSIRRKYCGLLKYRYTLCTDDPKNFLMMVMLSLAMFKRAERPTSI